MKKSKKELMGEISANMKNWQKIENGSVNSTAKIMEKTENPLIRLVMEIIQRDSQMHYRIQELIIDSLEKKAISLTPEELGDVWGLIEKHIELEKKTVELAEKSLEALKGTKMVAQQYLLGYLLKDEIKHNEMLETLESVKSGLYPYG
ncbi:MAG: hypothetical protein C4527_06535 [Candidatus Omnitrophota bacterium]|nr:MAG: hypothetical protein C4527_06535 [Candidatus Omnitrophota bacterium]